MSPIGASWRVALVGLALAWACMGPAAAQEVPGLGDPTLGAPLPSMPFRNDDRSVPSMAGANEASDALLPSRAGPLGPLAGAVDPATYRVGPGDVLQLVMWGKLSRTMLLEVGPEGRILLPSSGPVSVDGRTLEDVKDEVVRRMQAQLRGVSVDLRLARPRTFRVYLTGQVRVPGVVLATASSRVGDMLTPGALLENGSQRRIEVKRRDGTRVFADLGLFMLTGDARYNPALADGDVLNVPVATDFMHAAGAVARPGRYELGPGDSLQTLFRLAGDPLPAADAERVLLIRFKQPFQPESLWFSLDQAYSGEVNPEMREGDRLYVYYIPQYHLQHEASIYGEVPRPGVYPIVEGRHRLSDLVAAAGGFLPNADLSAIRVVRRMAGGEKDPELDRLLRLSRNELTASEFDKLNSRLASRREEYRVDWNRLRAAPADLDLLLRDGDHIRVDRLVSSVRVDGEVRRPAILAFGPGLGIQDYVRQAGGYTDRAWRGRVRVTRAVTGQVIEAKNVRAIDPGDLIWIPEKPDRTAWDQFRDLITVTTGIATVVLAIQSVR